jgi:nicotinamidase-related amidase
MVPLELGETALVVIDFQEKLMRAMHDNESLLQNAVRLVKGAKALNLSIIWTEQNPDGLGSTVPEIASVLDHVKPITKMSFSCCGEEEFMKRIEAAEPNQIIIAGIEAHVCVHQTAMDLLQFGYNDVQVVVDAVASRTPENKALALDRCKQMGVRLTGVEMALFELLKVAKGEKFKEILQVIK